MAATAVAGTASGARDATSRAAGMFFFLLSLFFFYYTNVYYRYIYLRIAANMLKRPWQEQQWQEQQQGLETQRLEQLVCFFYLPFSFFIILMFILDVSTYGSPPTRRNGHGSATRLKAY